MRINEFELRNLSNYFEKILKTMNALVSSFLDEFFYRITLILSFIHIFP